MVKRVEGEDDEGVGGGTEYGGDTQAAAAYVQPQPACVLNFLFA